MATESLGPCLQFRSYDETSFIVASAAGPFYMRPPAY